MDEVITGPKMSKRGLYRAMGRIRLIKKEIQICMYKKIWLFSIHNTQNISTAVPRTELGRCGRSNAHKEVEREKPQS